MGRESFFLHAPEGMGKSTLLTQLMTKLEGRRICTAISVRALSSESTFMTRLLSGLKQAAARYTNVDYQLRRILDENPQPTKLDVESMDRWMESLLVGLQSISQDFLFIFEDLHQWEGSADISRFFKQFFRSRNSHVILTADYPLQGLEKAENIELKPLKGDQLNSELNFHYYHQLVEDLLSYTAGNTAFTLEMIDHKALSNDPLKKSIEQVMGRYHSVYYSFRHRFTDLQWKLLRAIASEGIVAKPHSFDFLMNYRLGAASSVERALRNLSDSGMIVKKEEGWLISSITFQRWLQWLYGEKA